MQYKLTVVITVYYKTCRKSRHTKSSVQDKNVCRKFHQYLNNQFCSIIWHIICLLHARASLISKIIWAKQTGLNSWKRKENSKCIGKEMETVKGGYRCKWRIDCAQNTLYENWNKQLKY